MLIHYCVRGTRRQLLICVGCSVHYRVSCAVNKGGFFRDYICRRRWHTFWSEVKLPEPELLRNELKLLLCLLIFFTLIFSLNLMYTLNLVFSSYIIHYVLNLSLLWLWYRISKKNRWYLGDLMTWYFMQTSACNRKKSLGLPFTIITPLGTALLTSVLD